VLWEKVSFVGNSNKLFNLLLRGWFRIKGRSSRLEYIVRFLTMIFMCFISTTLSDFYDSDSESKIYILFMVIVMLMLLIILILSIIQVFFVTHRRLHDLNASGWWQLITFIPLGQLLMICFIFFKGTKGSNKYGLPPEY
jgi:uncharacterized membrane protein YhaH (DUF805 family)